LASGTSEIGGVQESNIRHGAVVLGVLVEGAEKAREGLRKELAKARGKANGLESSSKPAFPTKANGLIQRNAEHQVIGLKLL
jgi:hypothetical protein